MLKIRRISYESWVGDPSELVTMAEAVRMCGSTLQGLSHAVERGVLTEIIDDDTRFHGRRKLLRAEVEKYKLRESTVVK